MSFIRKRTEELTGFQESAPYHPSIDLGCDFVMVYGTDSSMPERVRQFRGQGYVIHLMTGISWGEYQDYLYGKWDGREHWDESQEDRNGSRIQHGDEVPYMVPTIAFTEYLTERLKIAVDAGVEAIHLEEPEFWDYGGYSKAFQREYQLYFHEEWRPPHTSLDVRYKSSQLKAYLYARALERISSALKEYAMVTYQKELRFYVPTHSLLNYTQWKIISPEGALIDIPSIDGYIAQVWTGTSREETVFEGCRKERTFETSFLEYGIMQELVKGTGRKIWFLHDPIEDNPDYTWENYRYNYLKTVTASLLHPHIHTYEICPWPNRVFHGHKYPIDRKTQLPREDAQAIPKDYATLLCGLVQTLGTMKQAVTSFDGVNSGVGILMSDSGLYQRSYPDGIVRQPDQMGRQTLATLQYPDNFSELLQETENNQDLFHSFIESGTFPNFFGMALPLLKYGLPVRPVQLDNVRRFPGYLDDYKNLVLSYEYIKPEMPDVNHALSAWVRSGGTLIYLGDGSDPYHQIDGWWNRGETRYQNPAEHLFEMMDLPPDCGDGTYSIGKGRFVLWKISPARLCVRQELAEEYRELLRGVLESGGDNWQYRNDLTLFRGPYIISAVLDESCEDREKVFSGLFADMYTPDFRIIREKRILPDENTLLFDFSKADSNGAFLVGTTARVFQFDSLEDGFFLKAKAAAGIWGNIRVRLPAPVSSIRSVDENQNNVEISSVWDEESQTLLITYQSEAQTVSITMK